MDKQEGLAAAAVDVIGVAMAALSIVACVYVVAIFARRAVAAGLRWSRGRPARRELALATGLACVISLTACWAAQGQLRGW